MADTRAMKWTPSAGGHVDRKRLHRVGDAESGQVTSVVRYRPGASFPAHDHPEGEEVLVLDGVFSDEHGDWAEGMHLLNAEGFRHTPFSREGCLLFVKLRQWAGRPTGSQRIDTNAMGWMGSERPGIELKTLDDAPEFGESTRLERWAAGGRTGPQTCSGGLELFVLEGSLDESGERLEAGAWLRLPDGGKLDGTTAEGCVLYLKEGGVRHLRSASR